MVILNYKDKTGKWNGIPALQGKSAYEYAKDGGYTGTEEEFAEKMAKEYPRNISELINDSGFITRTVTDLANYYLKSESYSKSEILNLISAIPKFKISVVDALPISGISETTIYLLKADAASPNLYTEYIFVLDPNYPKEPEDIEQGFPEGFGKWEILGEQTIDLSGYATETFVKNYAKPLGWVPSLDDIGCNTESWVFTLDDGTVVNKAVVLYD